MNWGSNTGGFTQGKWNLKDEIEMLGFNCSDIRNKKGYCQITVGVTDKSIRMDWSLKDLKRLSGIFDMYQISAKVASFKFKL